MLMADFSFVIQTIFHPTNIYELLLRHRQFIFLFAFIMDALIIYRFGLVGAGFALFYEFSKFYVFGDRFLAEGLIIYLMVYMLGVIWYKFSNRNITGKDYILSGIFTWLILFLREPYALVGLATYSIILFNRTQYKLKTASFAIFLVLSLIILALTSIKEYIFQVFTINGSFLLSGGPKGDGFLINGFKIFFYPIYLYFGGTWNLFRYLILGLDTVFLALLVLYIKFYKNFRLILILILLLGFANLRLVPPGFIFYGAFHLLPWYGMFIFSIFLILKEVKEKNKKIFWLSSVILIILFSYLTLSPSSYTREKINPQYELITNYGNVLQIGEVVRSLSKPQDTLFLDGADDLIYWQAKLLSPYKYSWYTSVMPFFPIYTKARQEMFTYNPPDFYYAFCTNGFPQSLPPKEVLKQYQPLYSYGKPTCLYIKKTKIPQITANQWKNAKDFKYELTEINN